MDINDLAKGAKIAAAVIGAVLTLITASADALDAVSRAVEADR